MLLRSRQLKAAARGHGLARCWLGWRSPILPSFPRSTKPSLSARGEVRGAATGGARGPGHGRKVEAHAGSTVLLIDGDNVAIENVSRFLSDLRGHGRVAEAKLYAGPRLLNNTRWKTFLAASKIDFIDVARAHSAVEDPNCAAIRDEVQSLLEGCSFENIALLANDKDYTELVEKIVAAGKKCTVCCVRQQPGAVELLRNAGAEVLQLPSSGSKQPSKPVVAVLHADGSGSVEREIVKSEVSELADIDALVSELQALCYCSRRDDPLLPAIAKFWFENGLGRLIVHPPSRAITLLAREFRERAQVSRVSGRQDLAFVFPVASRQVTWSMVEEYGDPKSAQLARGGGPFLLRDSPDLIEHIFKRMGYIDDDRNQLKDEAVEVFLRGERNNRELRRLGVVIDEGDSTLEKMSKIRLACLSSSCGGRWQLPPSDRNVREHLLSRGLLHRESSWDETSQAMEASVRSSGATPMKSYHGLVAQYQDVFFGRRQDPSRRR